MQAQSRSRMSHRFGRRVGIAAGALLCCGALEPAASAPPELSDLQVYAKQGIEAHRSDYQGPTASGGGIDISDFDIDGDLIAGGIIHFHRGQVHGAIRSPDARLDKVFATRVHAVGETDLTKLSAQLDDLGERLACLPATISPVITHGELLGKPISIVRLTASRELDVADLSAADLISEERNQLRLVLTGPSNSRLVIRVHGTSATLRDMGFTTKGGLDPSHIVFAFPGARNLTIASSGGAFGADGIEWGFPGSIVAPQSDAKLAAVTVTGQVFVRSIAPISGLPSGQINRLDPWAKRGDVFKPSAVLKLIQASARSSCRAE